MLGPYRVLDLTNQRGLLCGQMLADLGADVIQIEPPGGSPARRLGPFAGDLVDPERSLFWWAYARNKRGVTLDLKNGELWVSNFGGHSATAYRIDAGGNTAPLRTIRSAPESAPSLMIGNPGALTYDSKREEILVPN